jgi:hypothetical protein
VCVPSNVKLHPSPSSQVGEPSHVWPGSVQVLFQQVMSASHVGAPSHVSLESQVYEPLQVHVASHVGEVASHVGALSSSVAHGLESVVRPAHSGEASQVNGSDV